MTILFTSHLTHQVYQESIESHLNSTYYGLMIQLKNKKKPALVLSGGGIKAGAFHTGVCLALRQRGFSFGQSDNNPMDIKHFIGSSAGSVVATFLAAGYSLEEIIHAFTMGAGLDNLSKELNLNNQPIHLKPMGYLDIFSVSPKEALSRLLLPRFFSNKLNLKGGFELFLKKGIKVNGLFNTNNLQKYFAETALKTQSFDEIKNQLFIVATYLDYPKKAIFGPILDKPLKTQDNLDYISGVDISEAIAASTALPPVFSPFAITLPGAETPTYFFDGEIRDTMSTHVAADLGCDLIIASYSMSPYSYNKKLGSLNQYGIPLIMNQAIYQIIHQKVVDYRKHQEAYTRVIDILNEFCKEQEISGLQRDRLINKIVDTTNINLDAHYIYIHPSPQDHEIFFADHFSLNSSNLEMITSAGYKTAMEKLRIYDL